MKVNSNSISVNKIPSEEKDWFQESKQEICRSSEKNRHKQAKIYDIIVTFTSNKKKKDHLASNSCGYNFSQNSVKKNISL